MEDQDALSRSAYYTHMKRFIEVHRKHPNPIHGEILIGLERAERWEKNGLPPDECPTLEQIEAR